MLQQNLDIIKQRWPSLRSALQAASPCACQLTTATPEKTLVIDGIHLSSAYNRGAEAELQAALIPANSSRAYLYGIGCGDLPKTLLQRPALQQLQVAILNPAVALASFTHFDHTPWLKDPRVELLSGAEAELGTPLVAAPACLQLADEASARLRDLVSLELATPLLREKHHAENPEVVQQIKNNEAFVQTDGDVRELFNSQSGATIMVAGAGPSLGQSLDGIRANRSQCPLIAVNSALKPLVLAGILPDLVITIDPDPKIVSCFEGYDLEQLAEVPLVYFPRIPSRILNTWPGPRLTAYAEHPSYQQIRANYPRGSLFSSGTVLHPAVDLAVQMGAAEVLLFGADLAFPGGQKYTPGAGWQESDLPQKHHWVLDGHGNRVDTIASFRGYLRDLESYIATKPEVRFFNCSRNGAAIQGTRYLEDKK